MPEVRPTPRRTLIVALCLIVASSGIGLATPPRVVGETGFVTRSGPLLTLNGADFRFTGLNIYNANSDGTCGSVVDLDQALTEIGPGKAVMRAWFFQAMATTGGVRDWTRMDQTLASAAAHGLRVIPVLTNQWSDCDVGYGYKTKNWYETGYQDPDPAGTVSYRAWVAEIVSRYKDDPTVAFWQLINEAEIQDTEGGDCSLVTDPADTLRTWAADVGGLIKANDANHLVSLGTIGGGQCGTQGTDYKYVHSLPQIDLCEYHDYGSPLTPLPGDAFNGFAVRAQQCADPFTDSLHKPLFVGEAGIIADEVGGLQGRADAIAAKLDAQFDAGAVGFLAWAYVDPPNAGTFDIGAGDPTLGVLDLAAALPDAYTAWVVPSPAGQFASATALNDDGVVTGGRPPLIYAGTTPTNAWAWQSPANPPADATISPLPLPTTEPLSSAIGNAINGGGQIAGTYDAVGGSVRAFRYDPASGSSIDLGSLNESSPYWTQAFGINDAGVVVGESDHQGFVWTEATGITALAYAGERAVGVDINNSGVIVGYGRPTAVDPFHLLVWDSADPSQMASDLGEIGGSATPAVAVNDLGAIVGPGRLWMPDGFGGYSVSTVGGELLAVANDGAIVVAHQPALHYPDGTSRPVDVSDTAATAVWPEAISPNGRLLLARVFTPAGPYYAVMDLGPSTLPGFVVNDPGDSSDANPGNGSCLTAAGTCTLRAAIEELNAAAATTAQAVTFSITLPIRPSTPLPPLTSPAILDGTPTSQCDGSPPSVDLDGSFLGSLSDGLVLSGGGSVIRGLEIHSFPGSAVEITGAGGNLVECSYIGTDGSLDLGNGFGISVFGSPSNAIGGTGAWAGNLISGNSGPGITIRNAGADLNTVQGNRIGTDAAGSAAIPNGNGIFVTTGATNSLIGGAQPGAGNLISGNAERGVLVTSPSTVGTRVYGNLVGTDAAGLAPLGNVFGVSTEGTDTSIGDGTPAGRNVISGQSQFGITVGDTATQTSIRGNYIGTDITGSLAVGNRSGIYITGTSGTTIGGAQVGNANLISGNTLAGVQLVLGAHDNTIAGNLIGAGPSGELTGPSALGNGQYGVVLDGAFAITVGGTAPPEGNVIVQSGGAGVAILGGGDNWVMGNRITDNAGLGIDHGDDGVNINSSGPSLEADGVLNYPILTEVISDGVSTWVTGELNDTLANTAIRIEFFSNAECDPSGHGEGNQLVGLLAETSATPIVTDASGNAIFSLTLSEAVAPGSVVTATASSNLLGTSEFSPCAAVVAQPASGLIIVEQQTVPGGQAQSFTYAGAVTGDLVDNQTLSSTVDAGSFTVVQASLPGWNITDITCSDTDSTSDLAAGAATFAVAGGEVVRCVFTNEQQLQPTTLRLGSASGRIWWDAYGAASGVCDPSGGGTLMFSLLSRQVPRDWGAGSFEFSASLTMSALDPPLWDPAAGSLAAGMPSGSVASVDSAFFHVSAAEGYADVTLSSDFLPGAVNRAACVDWLHADLTDYFGTRWDSEDSTGYRYEARFTLAEYEAVIHPALGLPVRERGTVSLNLTAQDVTWPYGSNTSGGLFLTFATSSIEALGPGSYGGDSAQQSLSGGGTLSTDPEGDGAQPPTDLIEVSVTTPNAGYVTIDEIPTSSASGTAFDLADANLASIGWTVQITAPNATQLDPLIIEFRIDDSIYPSGGVVILRNGDPVPLCPVASGPCIAGSAAEGDDRLITVRTPEASWWDFAIAIPTADPGGPYQAVEGQIVVLDGTGSAGTEGVAPEFLWSTAGHLDDESSPSPVLNTSGLDDGIYDIDLGVVLPGGGTDSGSASLTVTNAPPTITEIAAPSEPLAVGSPLTVTTIFADPGTLDKHFATADFGDGSESSGTVDEPARQATFAHVYEAPGVYRVAVTISDDDGGIATESYEFVVVYDPDGGFVTGGGWIESPAGAYLADPLLSGRASFGFVSKYKKGANAPTGQTEFRFGAAGFDFHSSAYQWLVVSGARAQFKGWGEVNGTTGFGFLLTAVDGQINGGGGVDRFRIKIWELETETVIYDNQTGDADDANAKTELGGGSIVIHKPGK